MKMNYDIIIIWWTLDMNMSAKFDYLEIPSRNHCVSTNTTYHALPGAYVSVLLGKTVNTTIYE